MATKSIAWTTGTGNILLTYTGQGNGTIQVNSDPNPLGTARSQTIVVKTTDNAITRNLIINQVACPIPVGTVLNYNYTGSYQEVTLPAGSYKLQCWGAQGGSNAAYSPYNITAKAGGKGGYSEGVLTLSSSTKLRIYVGGQGSASAGGYNGGGNSVESSYYEQTKSWNTLGTFTYNKTWINTSGTRTYSFYNAPYLVNGNTYRITTNLTGTLQFACDQVNGTTKLINISSSDIITVNFETRSNGFAIRSSNTTDMSSSAYATVELLESSGEEGASRFGGGGGATDIRLSDAALLSRMIVAGGGSGGAMCWKKAYSFSQGVVLDCKNVGQSGDSTAKYHLICSLPNPTLNTTYTITVNSAVSNVGWDVNTYDPSQRWLNGGSWVGRNLTSYTCTNASRGIAVYVTGTFDDATLNTFECSITHTGRVESYSTSNVSQVGYVGGGTTGGGYSSAYKGKQNAAGTNGSFGQGANQSATNYRYVSGAGGGGWYGGGGGQKSDSNTNYCKYCGGGSGFVNISANASYRPTGYTGLQLDSGTTKDGATSFESTSGGTETGHSGNGYARITRLS